MARHRTTVAFTPQQYEWLVEIKNQTGSSIQDLVKRLVDDGKEADWSPGLEIQGSGAPKKPDDEISKHKKGSKGWFLAAVRRWYIPDLAGDKLGLTPKKTKSFCERWPLDVQRAMLLAVLDAEQELKDIGSGRKTGNYSALKSWLEANHPEWRSRAANVALKSLRPVIDEIKRVFRDTVGRQHGGECNECKTHWDSCVEIFEEALKDTYDRFKSLEEIDS